MELMWRLSVKEGQLLNQLEKLKDKMQKIKDDLDDASKEYSQVLLSQILFSAFFHHCVFSSADAFILQTFSRSFPSTCSDDYYPTDILSYMIY